VATLREQKYNIEVNLERKESYSSGRHRDLQIQKSSKFTVLGNNPKVLCLAILKGDL